MAKRQKTVFSTDEIAHLWAHKTQESARNQQHNFYFEGDTIYSYGSHFPIARHVHVDDNAAILFVDHGWSHTTAKHINYVRQSIPRGVPVFLVSDVRHDPKREYDDKRKDVMERIDKLKLAHPDQKYVPKGKTHKAKLKLAGTDDEIDVFAGKNLALHPANRAWRVSVLAGKNAGVAICPAMSRPEARIVLDILDHIKKWDIDDPKYRETLGKRVSAAISTARKYGTVSRNPGTLTKQYQTLLSKIEDFKRFATFFNFPDDVAVPVTLNYLDQIAMAHDAKKEASRAKREATRSARWKKLQETARLSFEERLPLWLAGEHVALDYHGNGTAYLRVQGNEVQTSQGARVPLEHVKKALPLVLAYVQNGREYKRNGHTIHLGHYVIDSIDADGTLKAGCHVFSKAEIERFAGVLQTLPIDLPPIIPPTAQQEQTV